MFQAQTRKTFSEAKKKTNKIDKLFYSFWMAMPAAAMEKKSARKEKQFVFKEKRWLFVKCKLLTCKKKKKEKTRITIRIWVITTPIGPDVCLTTKIPNLNKKKLYLILRNRAFLFLTVFPHPCFHV